jgi:hypothetical protein
MRPDLRWPLYGVFALVLISGCDFNSPWGSGGSGSVYGSSSAATSAGSGSAAGGVTKPGVGGERTINGADDSVVATLSVAGVSVATGSAQTISISFTSSDGLAITGFGISGSLGALPAGWSGPSTFTCALVSTGSGCVLNLTYAPTAVGSGSLILNYVYIDNANIPKAPGGAVTIPYAATPYNNVVAAVSPTGQINAIVGAGNQTVSVNFTTDDGYAATNLTLTTSLSALPSGWSSPETALSCAIVSSGSGCQLTLDYAPTAAGRGSLTLNYSYTDDSGAPRTGVLDISYSSASANAVVATAAPTGQINAIVKTGAQDVALTFTTDDGKPATNLFATSGLTALPLGWSSASKSFSCASVSTGNGCQLHLKYAPTTLAGGTLTLTYAYDDDVGTQHTGTLNLEYAATTNDNVVATPSPSGQINAVVGMGSQSLAVTFTTDDGRPATALQLTSDLTALPAGWSSTHSSFACSGLSSGNGCQLKLTYAPPAAGTGTMVLRYSYLNNAGEAKTGSVGVPYRATTNDNVVGTPNQSPIADVVGSSTPVTVIFTTDDGNLASALSVTSGLTSLPAGWSSTDSSFACSALSSGNGCELTLMYAPAVAGSGTLVLSYSYLNNAGFAKTGSVSISYRATTDDNVLGTPNQNPLAVAVGSLTPVTVTFTTDDGNPASALSVTSGLTSLPAGWSSTSSSFSCAAVSVGSGCQLALTFAPTAPASGILTLGFSYTNNSGIVKSGTVTIAYTAT